MIEELLLDLREGALRKETMDRAAQFIEKQKEYIETYQIQTNNLLTEKLRLEKRIDKLEAWLEEALEYIEDESDVVDGDDGQPEANRALSLSSEIRRVLENG